MATKREQILAALKTKLTGTTGVGTRIYRSRPEALTKASTPAIILEPVSDNPRETDNIFSKITWEFRVRVSVIVRGKIPDQKADPTVNSLYTKLLTDPTIGGLAIDIRPSVTNFEILEAEKSDDLFGIFHCFTGTLAQAHRAISYNMKLGIGGVVTFKNGKIDQFLSEIDLSHIVLETDAPYLSPEPFRGKRNESAYLLNVLDKVAVVYGMDKQDIAEITTNNALDIFKT